jgi:hypothetical protein
VRACVLGGRSRQLARAHGDKWSRYRLVGNGVLYETAGKGNITWIVMLESLSILAMRAMTLLYASRSSPAARKSVCCACARAAAACFLPPPPPPPPPCAAETRAAGHETTRRRSSRKQGTREATVGRARRPAGACFLPRIRQLQLQLQLLQGGAAAMDGPTTSDC